MIEVPVKVKLAPYLEAIGIGYEDILPRYAKPGDAGCDGHANIEQSITIPPGESRLIPLGVAVAIPEGYEIQVRPRSGLALKHGITVLNTPGTVDSGYRNEVAAILINHSREPFTVGPTDRVCQLVLNKVEQIAWIPVVELPESSRGLGGFGSTGGA